MTVTPVVTRGSRPLNKGRSGPGPGDWEPLQGGGLGPGTETLALTGVCPRRPPRPQPALCLQPSALHSLLPDSGRGGVCVFKWNVVYLPYSHSQSYCQALRLDSAYRLWFFPLPCLTCNINAWLKRCWLNYYYEHKRLPTPKFP